MHPHRVILLLCVHRLPFPASTPLTSAPAGQTSSLWPRGNSSKHPTAPSTSPLTHLSLTTKTVPVPSSVLKELPALRSPRRSPSFPRQERTRRPGPMLDHAGYRRPRTRPQRRRTNAMARTRGVAPPSSSRPCHHDPFVLTLSLQTITNAVLGNETAIATANRSPPLRQEKVP